MRMGTTSCRKSRRRTWAVFREPHSSEPFSFARKMTNFTLLPWTLTSRKLNHYSSERSRPVSLAMVADASHSHSALRSFMPLPDPALKCDLQIVVFVVNWFSQSIYLVGSDYFDLVKRLAAEQDHSLLSGINGVLFVTSAGGQFLFLDEAAKAIDS